jgi:hypothetical protein
MVLLTISSCIYSTGIFFEIDEILKNKLCSLLTLKEKAALENLKSLFKKEKKEKNYSF